MQAPSIGALAVSLTINPFVMDLIRVPNLSLRPLLSKRRGAWLCVIVNTLKTVLFVMALINAYRFKNFFSLVYKINFGCNNY